jgi:hypothetical protein
LKAARERERREAWERAISAAYQKGCDALRQNADVLAGFGVAVVSMLGFVVLTRKPKVTQPIDETRVPKFRGYHTQSR